MKPIFIVVIVLIASVTAMIILTSIRKRPETDWTDGSVTGLIWSQSAMVMNECFSFELREDENGEMTLSGHWFDEADMKLCDHERIRVGNDVMAAINELLAGAELTKYVAKAIDKYVLDKTTSVFSVTYRNGRSIRYDTQNKDVMRELFKLLTSC